MPTAPHDESRPSRRLLDPVSRISEILFGLIMALTFTGSLSAATAGREEVRTMLFGAIGCNIAWGLVDAVMFLVSRVTERGRGIATVRAVRTAVNPAAAHRTISDAMPPLLASIVRESELEAMRSRLNQLTTLPERPRLDRDDWLAALGVFLLVVVSTFPVVVPFMLLTETGLALRISNGIAIAMLFICGFRLGQYAGHRPWRMGFGMAVIGTALVLITIALGG